MRTRKWVALVAAGLLFGLAGCGTTLLYNGAKIDDEVPFLNVVEQQWRDTAGQDKYAQLAAETHCWLLRDPETDAIQSRALCGPVRHLATQDKPGVFDQMDFEPRLIGKDQVSVEPDSISWSDSGVEAPPNLELYHPEGAEPVDAEDVPKPPTPKAEPGIVSATEDGKIENVVTPKAGTLIMPGRTVAVSKVGTVATIPGGSAGGNGDVPFYGPAEGEEFLAFTMSMTPDEDSSNGSVDTSPTYSLKSGSTTVDLKPYLKPEEEDPYGGEEAVTVTLAMSVPKDQDASLVVGVAGLDQTISLKTGERTSKGAEANYLPKVEFAVNKQYATQKASNGDFEYTHGVTFTTASIAAFDPEKGWAPEGNMWFYLSWDNATADATGEADYRYASPVVNEAKSLQIVGTGNERISVAGGVPISSDDGWGGSSSGYVIAQAPVTAKGVKVTYQPQGTFAADSSYGDDEDLKPKSGSFTFKAESFDINFS